MLVGRGEMYKKHIHHLIEDMLKAFLFGAEFIHAYKWESSLDIKLNIITKGIK